MQVDEKQTTDAPSEQAASENVEGSSAHIVGEAPVSPLAKERDTVSIHSGIGSIRGPRFAAASPEFQSIFASMAIGRKDTPHTTVESVKSERMEKPEAQSDAEEATVPPEGKDSSFSPMPDDTGPLESPKVAVANPEHQSIFSSPEIESVEPERTGELVAQLEAAVATRPETRDIRLPPTPNKIEPVADPKFAAASLEYQSIFSSMAIRRKVGSTAPEKTPEPVVQPEAEVAIPPELKEPSHSLVPVAIEGKQKEETGVHLEDEGRSQQDIEGEYLSPPNHSLKVARMEQPIPQVNSEAFTQDGPKEESSKSISMEIERSERPKFAATSPEYWDVFTSMAIGRNVNTIEPERMEEPTAPKEPSITLLHDAIESEQIEKAMVVNLNVQGPAGLEIDRVSPSLVSTDVERLEKLRFAAASLECWNIFASMAIGAKPKPHRAVIASEKRVGSLGVLDSEKAAPATTEDEIPATILHTDTKGQTSEIPTTDPAYYQSLTRMTVEVETAPIVALTSKAPITEPLTPNSSVNTQSLADGITSAPPSPRAVKFAVASPEYQALFASMAITSKPAYGKDARLSRDYASEPHTPQRNASPTRHQEDSTFPSPPSTPEKKVSLSVPSSPRRRPATTDLVARRLIGAALGIRMATKKDEKTTTIKKALGMKDKGEGIAMWEEYVAGIEK
jgi:hypothetical protein